MLPKLCPLLDHFTVRLSDPLPEAQDSFVDIVLQFDRIVKSNLSRKGILYILMQFGGIDEPPERAARLVVRLGFF